MKRTHPPKSRPQSSLLFCTFVSSRRSLSFFLWGKWIVRAPWSRGSGRAPIPFQLKLPPSGSEHELVACLSGCRACLSACACRLVKLKIVNPRGKARRHYCPCVTRSEPLFIRPPYASCVPPLPPAAVADGFSHAHNKSRL